MTLELLDVRWLDKNDCVLTVQEFSWFGFVRRVENYRGSGTVWHRRSDGRRAGTKIEYLLSEFWTAAGWKRRDESRARLEGEGWLQPKNS